MAAFSKTLNRSQIQFIGRQPMFFVATAPERGRINLSPKGMDTFRCLDDRTVAYLDWTGSGNETAAHLDQNGRITVMFCSFGKKPNILRLYGKGTVIRPQHRSFSRLLASFGDDAPTEGLRQIMRVRLTTVQTSCGYAVPHMTLHGPRDTLIRYAKKKGPEGMKAYRAKHNTKSIDGIKVALPD